MKRFEKFKSYKITFFIFFTVIALAMSLGIYLFLSDSDFWSVADVCKRVTDKSADLSYVALMWDELFFLLVFVSGPTIYAPIVSFLSVFAYGIFLGVRISMGLGMSFGSIVIDILFSFLISYLLVVYSSFVTLTCLRIYDDTKNENTRELFDGVLFRARRFYSIFNLRYIASYIMFFTFFVLLVSALSLSRGFLLSL